MVIDPGLLDGPLSDAVAELPLVDHHVHGTLRTDIGRAAFESLITEAPSGPAGFTQFDSQVGFAIRRWCAPLLDLEPHADAEEYWRRRVGLGNGEVTRRLLRATGISDYLVDTGHRGDDVLDPVELAGVAGTGAREVVRLEAVAERLLARCSTGRQFVGDFAELLRVETADAVGVKSILAYRHGFDVPAERPGDDEVAAHAQAALDGGTAGRIADPVVLRYLLWAATDRGLPIQIHCGYGDPDLDLHRANPALLTGWLRLVAPSGVPVMLLHCYPYHREAGYLAQVFDNVYFDVGEGLNYVGAQGVQLVAESLELAPFHKQLFSTDAWGPAELHLLGSWLWRRAVCTVAGRWVTRGDWSLPDAERVVALIGNGNARRVYRL
jgi:predicted TIM-barrel fold metal-dependent hydrolase